MKYGELGDRFAAMVQGKEPFKDLSANRLYIRGANKTVYSYGRHFPVAIADDTGVAVTTAKYSQSTSRQTGEVRGALQRAEIPFTEEDLLLRR